jgi:hypothetical protein
MVDLHYEPVQFDDLKGGRRICAARPGYDVIRVPLLRRRHPLHLAAVVKVSGRVFRASLVVLITR